MRRRSPAATKRCKVLSTAARLPRSAKSPGTQTSSGLAAIRARRRKRKPVSCVKTSMSEIKHIFRIGRTSSEMRFKFRTGNARSRRGDCRDSSSGRLNCLGGIKVVVDTVADPSGGSLHGVPGTRLPRILKNCHYLVSRYRRKIVQKIVYSVTCFQMFEQNTNWNPGPGKHWSSTKNLRISINWHRFNLYVHVDLNTAQCKNWCAELKFFD